MMDPVTAMQAMAAAADAIQKFQGQQDEKAFQEKVSGQLSQILAGIQQLIVAVAEIRTLILALPDKIDSLFQKVESARIVGSANTADAQLRSLNPKQLKEGDYGTLTATANDIATAANTVRAAWFYAAWPVVMYGLLARIRIYTFLRDKDRAAMERAKVDLEDGINWLKAGVDRTSGDTNAPGHWIGVWTPQLQQIGSIVAPVEGKKILISRRTKGSPPPFFAVSYIFGLAGGLHAGGFIANWTETPWCTPDDSPNNYGVNYAPYPLTEIQGGGDGWKGQVAGRFGAIMADLNARRATYVEITPQLAAANVMAQRMEVMIAGFQVNLDAVNKWLADHP